ncbi:MAG: S8 family serine peptidase [Pseudomonadota bacterium]
MTKFTFILSFSALLLAAIGTTQVQAQPIPGEYIIVLHDQGDAQTVANAHGASIKHRYTSVFNGFAGKVPAQALQGLANNPHVAFIQQDRQVHAIGQITPTGVDRIEADLLFSTAPVDAGVAVIDTGIDLDHPDLNVQHGVNCTRLDKKTHQCKVGGDDDNGHGSHVAGIIGAYNDDNGVVGVAPGVRLYAVKVLDRNGSGTLSGVIDGIEWVMNNAGTYGISVANLSLGGTGTDDTDGNPNGCNVTTDAEHMALCGLIGVGVTVVVAAGNESDDTMFHTPGAFDEVITVSALSDFDGIPGGFGSDTYAFSSCTESVDDSFGCFSNYGHDVDIMAPGMGIYSTYMNGGYATMSGTSMACPHVAGAAALLTAGDPSLTPQEVRDALVASGDPAPCATEDGICDDDPDGIQEPLLLVAEPAPPCVLDSECDDGLFCNGVETCVQGLCVTGAGPCADDGIACTVETCDEGADVCASAPSDALCGVGAPPCGDSWCDPTLGCIYPVGAPCNDEDVCTVGDACDDLGFCVGTLNLDCAECGDSVCAGAALGEDCHTCGTDCGCIGKNCKNGCCGDGSCGKSETATGCPVDCL